MLATRLSLCCGTQKTIWGRKSAFGDWTLIPPSASMVGDGPPGIVNSNGAANERLLGMELHAQGQSRSRSEEREWQISPFPTITNLGDDPRKYGWTLASFVLACKRPRRRSVVFPQDLTHQKQVGE
jgi:hypothetical protein